MTDVMANDLPRQAREAVDKHPPLEVLDTAVLALFTFVGIVAGFVYKLAWHGFVGYLVLCWLAVQHGWHKTAPKAKVVPEPNQQVFAQGSTSAYRLPD
jgi:hypothetical protein